MDEKRVGRNMEGISISDKSSYNIRQIIKIIIPIIVVFIDFVN